MKAAELCAGYGGLARAIEAVFGAEMAWMSEFEEAPSKILKHHWPDAPNHGDMTKIDWNTVEVVELLGGGTPCQDLSTSGKRQGMTAGTRSNLWVNMREAIATIKPKYVVWENVRGAYSAEADSDLEHCPGCMGASSDPRVVLRALGRVLGDLSDLGYDCQWRGLRAADVGAPHGRFRVFVLATHRDHLRINGTGERPKQGRWGQPKNRRLTLADDNCDGREGIAEPDGGSTARREVQLGGDAHRRSDAPAIPESFGGRKGRPEYAGVERRSDAFLSSDADWGEYEPAIRRWEATLGRRAPAPTEPTGRDGGQRLSARFAEWMMGVPDGWIVDVPGIARNEALKAAGNGVVPQQAIAALRDMLAATQALEEAA